MKSVLNSTEKINFNDKNENNQEFSILNQPKPNHMCSNQNLYFADQIHSMDLQSHNYVQSDFLNSIRSSNQKTDLNGVLLSWDSNFNNSLPMENGYIESISHLSNTSSNSQLNTKSSASSPYYLETKQRLSASSDLQITEDSPKKPIPLVYPSTQSMYFSPNYSLVSQNHSHYSVQAKQPENNNKSINEFNPIYTNNSNFYPWQSNQSSSSPFSISNFTNNVRNNRNKAANNNNNNEEDDLRHFNEFHPHPHNLHQMSHKVNF